MNILVTGGTGLVGSHVVESLIRSGHDVTVLLRPGSDGRRVPADARQVTGDVTHPDSLARAFARQEAVIHAAGVVSPRASWALYRSVVVRGTRNVARAAAAAGVARLVHLSSLIVHAEPARGVPLREQSPLLRRVPRWNHYARAKLLAERIVHQAHSQRNVSVVVLRPGVVIGPRDRHTTPWILHALRHPPVFLVGRGDNRIPCVVVEELADAVATVVSRPEVANRAYALAGATPLTQRELVLLHARAIGVEARVVPVPAGIARATARLLDACDRQAPRRARSSRRLATEIARVDATVDGSRAQVELGWRGAASYADAIGRAVAWAREETPASVRKPQVAPPEQVPHRVEIS